MSDLDNVRRWIEAGKQVGKNLRVEKNGENYWVSIGIQKWEGIYKLYLSEIAESLMPNDDYLTEEIIRIDTFEELPTIMAAKTLAKLEDLVPLKGQRIFNPKLDS